MIRLGSRLARPRRQPKNGTRHWLTPSRGAETDLPPDVIAAMCRTTAAADPDSLTDAIAAAWVCGRSYWRRLAQLAGRPAPDPLFADLDAALSG